MYLQSLRALTDDGRELHTASVKCKFILRREIRTFQQWQIANLPYADCAVLYGLPEF